MNTSTKNSKEIAQDFLAMITAGEIREAFRLYIAEVFWHHNIFFKGGRNSLLAAMEENQVHFPNKVSTVIHALQDAQLVSIHLHDRMSTEDQTGSLLFTFSVLDRIGLLRLRVSGNKCRKKLLTKMACFDFPASTEPGAI